MTIQMKPVSVAGQQTLYDAESKRWGDTYWLSLVDEGTGEPLDVVLSREALESLIEVAGIHYEGL